jgi:Outer membrane protein beta-barrel family/Carboxypeptidase regulatory-like domain
MKKLPLLIIFIIVVSGVPFPGKAQEVKISLHGRIKDSLTKKNLPDATVSLQRVPGSTVFNTISDNKGYFSFHNILPGAYQLKIEYIGYNSFSKNVTIPEGGETNKTTDNIYLSLKKDILQAATVTSTLAKPLIILSAGKITLNIASSPLSVTSNAYDILLRAPGVTEQNGDLRFRARTVNILIDGKQTNLSGDDLKNMLLAMPGTDIEKVEILPNPSAKYDAQGGSLINIKLARNKNYGLGGTIQAGAGAGRYGKYNAGLTTNYRDKRINVYGSYNFEHNETYYHNSSDRVISPISDILQDERGTRTTNNHSYRLGVDYELSSNQSFGIQFKGYSNFQDRSSTDYSTLTNTATAMDTSSLVSAGGHSRTVNPSVNLYYKVALDSIGSELVINADYFKYDKRWNDNFITNYFDQNGHEYLEPYLLRDQSPADNTIKSFTADYSHPSKAGNFEAGIKASYTTTDNNIIWQDEVSNEWLTDSTKTNHFIYRENINAAYLTWEKAFKEAWQFNAGIRTEYTYTKGDLLNTGQVTTKQYLDWFPNVTAQYLKNVSNVFNLSYRKSIDRFGFDIVNPFIRYQSQYAYYQGNPDISPAINHNLEFTYTLKQATIFGASYTHTLNALGPVYLKGADNATISSFTNFKSDDLFYVYAYWRKQLLRKWTTNLIGGAGFLRYNTASAASTQKSENATWSYLLQWNNSFNVHGWSAELNTSYQGPLASGIYKLGAIFSSSMGVSRQLWKNNASVKLSVTDLLNTQMKDIHINYDGVVMRQQLKPESRFIDLRFSYRLGNKNVRAKKERVSRISDLEDRMTN